MSFYNNRLNFKWHVFHYKYKKDLGLRDVYWSCAVVCGGRGGGVGHFEMEIAPAIETNSRRWIKEVIIVGLKG